MTDQFRLQSGDITEEQEQAALEELIKVIRARPHSIVAFWTTKHNGEIFAHSIGCGGDVIRACLFGGPTLAANIRVSAEEIAEVQANPPAPNEIN